MMKTLIRKGFALVVVATPVFAGPSETLELASAVHEQALAQEHGWSVTEPLIEEARAAMAKGELHRAQILADRALLTAKQSLLQAQHEKNAWQARVIGQ